MNNIKDTCQLLQDIDAHIVHVYNETMCMSEGLKQCMIQSPNKPPFSINFLEYCNCRETMTSWIIRHLFAYTYNGHHPFFESFASTFLQRIGFDMKWIESPCIDKDHEYKGVDILIRDKQYAIIIENKLKGADFQINQLARYIATMRKEGYTDKQIYIIILPKDDITSDDLRISVWNLPYDWQSTTIQNRKCKINNYSCWCDRLDYTPKVYCRECEPMKNMFVNHTLFIHSEFACWLFDCVSKNTLKLSEEELEKQYVLVSASLQFVDYLNFIYNNRENHKLKMEIQKFLCDQLKLDDIEGLLDQIELIEDKKKDADKLVNELDDLYWRKIKEYISSIGRKYQVHIIEDEKYENYFHCELNFQGEVLKVILNNEGQDYCQIETRSRRRIPEAIKNDFEISEELNDQRGMKNAIWKYDSYKESLLRFDRVLGRLLDIINSQTQ